MALRRRRDESQRCGHWRDRNRVAPAPCRSCRKALRREIWGWSAGRARARLARGVSRRLAPWSCRDCRAPSFHPPCHRECRTSPGCSPPSDRWVHPRSCALAGRGRVRCVRDATRSAADFRDHEIGHAVDLTHHGNVLPVGTDLGRLVAWFEQIALEGHQRIGARDLIHHLARPRFDHPRQGSPRRKIQG